jgi:signal peptide peptidase SppA
MRYAHILSTLRTAPWFATEATLESVDQLLRSRLAATPRAHEDNPDLYDEDDDKTPVAPAAPVVYPAIPVVRVHGVLGKHLSGMAISCGGADYDDRVRAIGEAARAATSQAVVVHFHSPGGMAQGCAEAFDAIRRIRAETGKPIYAFVDGNCCSAAYYMAGACDAIYATRSAQLGCIGAMHTLTVATEANAKAGIVRRTFKTATMKDLGNPYRERTPEEDAVIQARIDYLGGIFRTDMAASRPQIAAEVFETGLSYFAPDALRLGLVDEIVPDLASLL